MGYYKLYPGVKLRGYFAVPIAVYTQYAQCAFGLCEDEFDVIKRCDGQTQLADNEILQGLLAKQLVIPCEKGDRNKPWQSYKFCDNRYFPAAEISITGKCGFRCRHCFNAEDAGPEQGELSYAELLDLIAQLDDCGVHALEITGGEPLIHPHFKELLREIAARGMHLYELVTTAHHVTAELLDEMIALGLRPMFKLSFDGIGHHDWFRKAPGAEAKLIENIKRIKSKGFCMRVHINAYHGNANTILPTALLCDALGVDIIQIIRTSESPRVMATGLQDQCFTMEEYYDFGLDIVCDFIQAGGKNQIDIWQFMVANPSSRTYVFRTFASDGDAYRDSLPVCKRNRSKITINHDGALIPCMPLGGLMKSRNIDMGNIKNASIKELLTYSPFLEYVCMTVGELKQRASKCAECAYWEICTGGCRVIGTLYGDGDLYAPDVSKCLFFEQYLEKSIAKMQQTGFYCLNTFVGNILQKRMDEENACAAASHMH